MNLLVVSDLHLSPQSEERNRQFLSFLADAKNRGDEVLILGDLFDLWFGNSDLSFRYQADIINRMNDLAQSGLRMDYVEGNRDFNIKRLQGRTFRRVESGPLRVNWGERTIHVEHGDLINIEDRPYRFFRAITKNPFSFFIMDSVPSFILLSVAARMERKLKSTNLRNKMRYPEEHCRNFYMEQFGKGADIVILGHFHQEREIETQLNGRTVLFYNLPGWEGGFRYLVVPPGKGKPYFTEPGRD